eukprot:10096447-Prorocentrum_lima.AAC.1
MTLRDAQSRANRRCLAEAAESDTQLIHLHECEKARRDAAELELAVAALRQKNRLLEARAEALEAQLRIAEGTARIPEPSRACKSEPHRGGVHASCT